MKTLHSYELQFSPEKTVELLTQIVSGLLASGHFTYPPDSLDEDSVPGQEQVIRGRRLNDAGQPRYHSAVVEAATDIFHSIRMDVFKDVTEYPQDFLLPQDYLAQLDETHRPPNY
jgi:hypothetical protein